MMKGKSFFLLLFLLFFSIGVSAQEGFSSEEELKEKAEQLFEEKKLIDAAPLYAQLLSLYPKDANYNFKYGACLIASGEEKEEAIKYLKFSIAKPETDALAYYYLARAYHLNYDFAKAVKQYGNFKRKASSKVLKDFDVDRQIEMCKNGNKLLSKLNEVQVIDKQEIAEKDFFRIYDLQDISGKIIAKPIDFQSKYDSKNNEQSVIYLPDDAKEVYYSSYGKKGENGRDIYKSIRLGNGKWSEGVPLGPSINTPYDENYAFIHPDGVSLYFSSNGHNSMGGYDIFKSVFDANTNQWGTPENLDFAFNSTGDDILFITDKSQEVAHFASDRNSPAGQLNVYKVLVERAPAELSAIEGKFIAEDFPDLKSAKVSVIDQDSKKTIGVFNTDEKGNYTIEIPKNGGDYQFNIETTSDAPIHTGVVSIPEQDEFQVLAQELRLVNEGGEQQLVIKNIFDGSNTKDIAVTSPQVSAATIRQKAKLEVNFSESQLAELENKTKDQQQTDVADKPSEPIEGQASSSEEQNKADNIRNQFNQLATDFHEDLEQQSRLTDEAFRQSIALAEQADRSFEGAAENSPEMDQSKEIATKAALSLELAKDLDRNLKEVKEWKSGFAKDSTDLLELIEQEQMPQAEQKLKEINNYAKLMQAKANVEKIAENKQKANEQEIDKLQEEKLVLDKKLKSLDRDIENKELRIDDLKEKIKDTEGDESSQLQEQLKELELDQKDLDFQRKRVQKEIQANKTEQNVLALKAESIAKIKEEMARMGEEQATSDMEPLSQSDKLAVEESVRAYRENNQLSYTETTSAKESDSQTERSDSGIEPKTETAITEDEIPAEGGEKADELKSKNVEAINNKYQSALAETPQNAQLQTKKEREDIYSSWKADLENVMMEQEAALSTVEDQAQRSQIQEEIRNIQEKIDQLDQFQAAESDQVAVDQPLAQEEDVQEERVTLEEGESNVQPEEEKISFSADVAEVDDETIVEDDFTNLDFAQDYAYGNQKPSQTMAFAKKTLFEAGKIAEEAEKAKQSAFTLPTPEERSAAFEKANRLEKLSEEKQEEAAQFFAQYNREEYRINDQRIANANQFESEFESEDLDLANLLAEEATLYIEKAQVIRSQIEPQGRLGKKEAQLQKAYDFEMLALEKQRQALSKLSLVDDAILQETTIEEKGETEEFVQAISDPEILKISSASLAAEKSDSALKVAEQIQFKAAEVENQMEELPVGSERDSMAAVYEELKTEAEKNKTLAAVYYEREKQIKSGISGQTERNKKGSQILKPFQSTYLTQVNIDTVNIDENRKEQLFSSRGFQDFLQNEAKLKNLLRQAEVDYQLARDAEEQNEQLKKEAVILNNKAELTEDAAEKQRLIKAAEVINVEVQKNQQKIDSLNTRLKVKNFMIAQNEQKNKASLGRLTELERKEYVSLTATDQGDSLVEAYREQLLAEAKVFSDSLNLIAEETSLERKDLQSIPPDEVSSGSIEEGEGKEEEIKSISDDNETDQVAPEEEVIDSEPAPLEREEAPVTQVDEPKEEAVEKTPDDQERENQSADPIVEDVEREDDEIEESRVSNNAEKEEDKAFSADLSIPVERINEVPREIKQAIFVTFDKNQSIYGRNQPIPEKTKLPEGIIYKVQVGAYRNPIPQDLFKGFAPIMAEKTTSGITRYTAGLFKNESIATNARDQIRNMGYPDAFVVSFLNGERINLSKARSVQGVEEPVSEQYNTDFERKIEEGVAAETQADQKRLSPAFNAEDIAPVTNAKELEQLYFTVQIGVYSKPLGKGVFNYENLNVFELPSGLIRYNVGIYENAIDAAERQIEIQMRIPDAFVVAYYRGKRISINEAARLKNR